MKKVCSLPTTVAVWKEEEYQQERENLGSGGNGPRSVFWFSFSSVSFRIVRASYCFQNADTKSMGDSSVRLNPNNKKTAPSLRFPQVYIQSGYYTHTRPRLGSSRPPAASSCLDTEDATSPG